MKTKKADNLVCPIDGLKLETSSKQWSCSNGHSFDVARQGYVNLLPVQQKRSKHPGDSKEMVVARTRFLNSGLYQPLAKTITELISTLITDNETLSLLDAGCGEGYYFDYLFHALNETDKNYTLSFIGLDISKEAIAQASKRNKDINWIVASNRQPPIENESVDMILCLFGFLSVDGFFKVLKPGGKLILVDPGVEHLKELREIIYPEINKADPSSSSQMEITGFISVQTEELQFKANITSNEQVNNLLIMTPHFYRASKAGREAACALSELEITVDVTFGVFEKI